jgi:hypothetical protein
VPFVVVRPALDLSRPHRQHRRPVSTVSPIQATRSTC